MLADRDPNTSGRTSRASNLSAMSRATYRQHGGADKQDLLASAPGVMSMLRTSTEMGNVVGLTGDLPGMSNVPRAPQRRGASSRLSMASSMSGTSSRASRHHRQWPSSSSAPRHSSMREPSGPQYVADTLSPTVMNLPGSSPLIPTRHRSSRNNRDSQRSFSMTNTEQPTFRLSSNRSLGSLRSHEQIQRPRSPYIYPTRLRRPSYRPASPALSDMTGQRPQRLHGHGSQGQIPHQGQMRLRIPSDPSLGYQDRASGMPRHPSRGHSPAYYNGYQEEIPPVPPLFHPRMPLERPRVIHRSIRGSFSSGSTNRRNDSDTPSSDLPSPPTPRDGSSLEVMLSPTGTQVLVETMKEDVASGPLYYDYSEQFEREEILEPEVNPVQAGFVNNIKTIYEERGSSLPPSTPARGTSGSRSTRVSNTAVPGIAELPASPVARRITRDLILEALGPSSTTEESDGTAEHSTTNATDRQLQVEDPQGAAILTQMRSSVRIQDPVQRSSILSQADMSVVDSSTLDFAVRYSIPIVTGAQIGSDAPPMPDRDPPLPPNSAPSTEVDMSDLLAGYQHTVSKHEDDNAAQEEEKACHAGANEDQAAEKRSNHAQKSSDAQSFKSATDVLESELDEGEPEDDEDDENSYKSATGEVVEKEPSVKEVDVKEVDAYSFTTAKDATMPGRSVSMPVSRPLPVVLADVETPRPTSQAPLSSPPPVVLRKPRVPPRESSFPLANKFRGVSKPSIKQGSVSISGSSSTLSFNHQPPSVPPRESSTSKEAQRSMGVASWMLFKRWGKKPSNDEDLVKTENSSRETLQEPRSTNSVTSSQLSLSATIKTPEKALFKENTVPVKEVGKPKDCAPPQVYNASVAPPLHQHSFSSPSLVVAESLSVYSPQDNSSRTRVQPSPAGVPKSADDRRDSQTTTHLVWHGRKSLNLSNSAASIGERQLPLLTSSEDTTTDLRLSQYRYPGGLHYLPDLKEESHEDSSLNTSASNLKNSNFRFPFGVPAGVRASVDEGIVFSRRSSMGSYRRSALGSAGIGQTHGLPSMNFSRMNLFEKLDEEYRLRHSRSLDHLPLEAPAPVEGTPQRPVSAGEMREKYRSFCDKLDQLNTPEDARRAEMSNLLRRATLSSPELLAEIDGVTVPSVMGLTERLSELLPSLREYYKLGNQSEFASEEMIMEHAMEDIHEVGGPAQKRSSARLRPIPGSPNMVVIEDALYEELTGKEKGDDVVVAQGDEGVERAHGGARASEKTKDNSSTRPKTPFAELEAPSPVAIRQRALTVGHQDLRGSAESGLITRSLRSSASTPTRTDTRPWNFDKNYPWATSTIPSVDISLPPPTAVRHSPRPGPSHLRNNISDASTGSTFTTPVGSPLGTDSGSSAHARQLHHFSAFGRSGDQPHAVGERYPTSALTPPTAIFRDNFSASDTSDDETEPRVVRKGKFSLKKRFSSAHNATLDNSTRATNKSLTVSNTPLELTSPDSAHRSATSIIQDTAGEARAFTSNRHTFRDAEALVAQRRRPNQKLIAPISDYDFPFVVIMDNYKSHPDYYHYKSKNFKVGLMYSGIIFDWNVIKRYQGRPRLGYRVPPNTPTGEWFFADDDDEGYDAGDEYDEFDEYNDHKYRTGDYYDWPEEMYDWEDEDTSCPWSVGYISDNLAASSASRQSFTN